MGYERARSVELSDAALSGGPRTITGDARYLWLNRTLCLGIGELRTRARQLDFDLFAIGMP